MAQNLQEFYANTGRTLPSIYERSVLFEGLGLGHRDSYKGTAEQKASALAIAERTFRHRRDQAHERLVLLFRAAEAGITLTIERHPAGRPPIAIESA